MHDVKRIETARRYIHLVAITFLLSAGLWQAHRRWHEDGRRRRRRGYKAPSASPAAAAGRRSIVSVDDDGHLGGWLRLRSTVEGRAAPTQRVDARAKRSSPHARRRQRPPEEGQSPPPLRCHHRCLVDDPPIAHHHQIRRSAQASSQPSAPATSQVNYCCWSQVTVISELLVRQGTSLFTSTALCQIGCPKGGPKRALARFPKALKRRNCC